MAFSLVGMFFFSLNCEVMNLKTEIKERKVNYFMVQWLRYLIGVRFLALLSGMSEVVPRAVGVQQGRQTSFPEEETAE